MELRRAPLPDWRTQRKLRDQLPRHHLSHRRVVITGIGAITPIGLGKDGLWKGLLAHKSAVTEATRFDSSQFRSKLAAEVSNSAYKAADHFDAKRVRRLDRFGQFPLLASRQAIADAHLDLTKENKERIG